MHDRRCIISPPPHDTLTATPAAFVLTQGVDTIDQGDQPPSMVMTRLPWPRTGVIKAVKVTTRTTTTNEPKWNIVTFGRKNPFLTLKRAFLGQTRMFLKLDFFKTSVCPDSGRLNKVSNYSSFHTYVC